MEVQPSVGKTEREKRRGSPDSSTASRTTTNTNASRDKFRDPKISPPSVVLYENCPTHSQASGSRNATVIVAKASTCYTRDHGLQGKESYIALTTQTLQLHNLQQPGSPKILESQHTTRQGDATNSEAFDSLGSDVKEGSTTILKSKQLPEDASHQVQGQQSNLGSMYHADDRDSYTLTQSSVQDHVTDDDHVVEYLAWNMDSAQELTAWGNDLAGVGEHLGGYEYHECASLDELVVE